MSIMVNSRSSGSLVLLMCITVIVCVVAVVAFAIPNSHYDKHGQDGIDANKCMQNPVNIIQILFNPDTCRYGYIGQMNGSTYIEITELDQQTGVTGMKMSKTLEKIIRWFNNTGYK